MTFDLNELEKHSSGICAIVNWMHSDSNAQNKFATSEISSIHLKKMKKWWEEILWLFGSQDQILTIFTVTCNSLSEEVWVKFIPSLYTTKKRK
jgi:hypothetical protein